MRKLVRVAITVLAIAAAFGSGAVANAKQRWPVIGCANFNQPFPNLDNLTFAPTRVCTLTGTTAGIDHAHWKDWGAKQATATGDFVDSLGFTYPAKMTAYGLHKTNNFLGGGTYAAWYTKLHVIAKREYRGGVYRGPFNVFLNVTPEG
jgi:hypothetical protein